MPRPEHTKQAVERWRDHLQFVVDNHPNVVWFDPKKVGFSVTTFSCRLRDACKAQRTYKYDNILSPEQQEKLERIGNDFTFAVHENFVVVGSKESVRNALRQVKPTKNHATKARLSAQRVNDITNDTKLESADNGTTLSPADQERLLGLCMLVYYNVIDEAVFTELTSDDLLRYLQALPNAFPNIVAVESLSDAPGEYEEYTKCGKFDIIPSVDSVILILHVPNEDHNSDDSDE